MYTRQYLRGDSNRPGRHGNNVAGNLSTSYGHSENHSGNTGAGGGGGAGGRRRYFGRNFRRRTSPSRQQDRPDHQDNYTTGQQHSSQPSSHRSNQEQSNHNNYASNNNNSNQSRRHRGDSSNQQQFDIDEIRDLCLKLNNVLELVKTRIDSIANNVEQLKKNQHQQATTSTNTDPTNANENNVSGKRRKRLVKVNDRREGANKNEDLASTAARVGRKTPEKRDSKRRNQRRGGDSRDGGSNDKRDTSNNGAPAVSSLARGGDESTTQAADPSSEDKLDGEDGQNGERGVRRVFRRRKQQYSKRRYLNRRRRNDSSERNSNDTSPQNEINGDDYRSTTNKSSSSASRRDRHSNGIGRKRSFPELSESEISELVQVLRRDFFTPELDAVKKTIDNKGPVVAQEFASSILEYAMCDVTSPTKLSEIATNLYQLVMSEQGGLEFQQGFYGALASTAKREEDIAIDAPRYMDTLGQILGECVVPMNNNRHKQLLRRFLNKCLTSYGQKSRAQLLAATMRGIARHKEERFAKDIWDVANLRWNNFLPDDTDLKQFVESEDVAFTTKTFSPLPKKPKKTPEELSKFADDVTNLVEKKCTPQTLEELVHDLELDFDERIEYLGTLVYAIVRGCLTTDSGEYKLDTEVLHKYSSILNGKSQISLSSTMNMVVDGDNKKQSSSKKESLDAIALHALTALTKLWHQYNCPQNLMSTILLALHGHGAASYDALKTWLNSEDLKNIPGIGAARLNSKRCIEDLVASRG